VEEVRVGGHEDPLQNRHDHLHQGVPSPCGLAPDGQVLVVIRQLKDYDALRLSVLIDSRGVHLELVDRLTALVASSAWVLLERRPALISLAHCEGTVRPKGGRDRAGRLGTHSWQRCAACWILWEDPCL